MNKRNDEKLINKCKEWKFETEKPKNFSIKRGIYYIRVNDLVEADFKKINYVIYNPYNKNSFYELSYQKI